MNYRNGEKQEYTGGRTEHEIVNWMLKRFGPSSTEVTCEQLKEKLVDSKYAVAYIGDFSQREFSEVFISASEDSKMGEKYQFFHSSDVECGSSYQASSFPAIVLFRKFDTSPLVFEEIW